MTACLMMLMMMFLRRSILCLWAEHSSVASVGCVRHGGVLGVRRVGWRQVIRLAW